MKKRFLPGANDKGLTLIELVIAIALLTFGVIAAMTVLVQAQSSTNATTAKTMAINAAQQQMELILNDSPSNVLNWNGTTFPVGDLAAPGGGQPGFITVAPTAPRTITITVTWQGLGTLPSGRVMISALRSEAAR